MEQTQVYVNGLGMVSRVTGTAEGLGELSSDVQIQTLPLEFPCEIPSSKLRRTSRYTKMACAAADQALRDYPACSDAEPHRIGTIISTGYGAAQYSSEFADSVVKGNAGACSPAIFTGSVPNSCVGQICIIYGLKGPSTVLAGGDPLEYASLLLKTGRADHILCGSVEEYYAPLYDSAASMDAARGSDLSEGAAMLLLGREKTENSYCSVAAFAGLSLGLNPYIHTLEHAGTLIEGVLRQMEQPEAIFTAANGTYFDETESQAIASVFPGITQEQPKKLFGETLGASYMMSSALAAARIKSGRYKSVLVTGVDMIGNYCCTLLKI